MDLELRLPAWILIPNYNYGKRLSLKGTRKKSVQLGMNWLSQCCDCMVFLPLTFLSGFCVKSVSTWLTVLPAPCFQVRLEFSFLSFPHAKVEPEQLVYFIVSSHSVLILYFTKWLGLNLRRTKFLKVYSRLSTPSKILRAYFVDFPKQHLPPALNKNVTIARLNKTSLVPFHVK